MYFSGCETTVMRNHQHLPSGSQCRTQKQQETFERNMKSCFAGVKMDIDLTFSKVAELVQNRKEMLLRQVGDYEQKAMDMLARQQQQLSQWSYLIPSRCQSDAANESQHSIEFCADLSALQLEINKFGKVELTSDFVAAPPADEGEDDFIVLAHECDLPSVQDDGELMDAADMSQNACGDEELQRNPIADVVERVALDNDEAWLSRSTSAAVSDMMQGWDAVTDNGSEFSFAPAAAEKMVKRFTFSAAHYPLHYWLAQADDRGKDDVIASENESSDFHHLDADEQPSSDVFQWYVGRQLTHNTGEEHLHGENMNLLRDVINTVYCESKNDPSTSQIPADEAQKISDTTSKHKSEVECEIGKILAKISATPADFWLPADRAQKTHENRPLSYWLCPASSSAVVPERSGTCPIFTSSADKSFASFVQKVVSSSFTQWLASSSVNPFKCSNFSTWESCSVQVVPVGSSTKDGWRFHFI